jgi:hypothetical protein
MNWYLKNIFAQATAMLGYLESLGASPDIVQYISSLDPNFGQILTNEFRKNPSLNLQQLQQFQSPQQIDPYLPTEKNIANRYDSSFSKWLLVQFKKIRKSSMDPENQLSPEDFQDYIDFITYGYYGSNTNVIQEIDDWYTRSQNQADIASFSLEQAIDASAEWHRMMAGKGAGKEYEPTKSELIVFGPEWKNDKKWQGWTIQKVISENDLLAEGNMMNHCVGDYCQDVISEKSIIYSLRDPQNNPKATIETDGTGKIVEQIQGNSNSTPDEEHRDMIREWVEYGKNTPERLGGTSTSEWDIGGDLSTIAEQLKDLQNGYTSEQDNYKNYLAGDYGLQGTESDEFIEWSNNLDIGRLMGIIFETMTYEYGPKNAEDISWHSSWIDTELLSTIEGSDGYGGEKPGLKELINILKGEIRDNASSYGENAPVIKSFAEHMLKLIYMPEGQTSFDFSYSSCKNWYKIAQQIEVMDSKDLKGKERFYTGIGHDIYYKEQNKALGHEPNENYSINNPNIMWVYNNGQIETRPETGTDQTHRSRGNWGLDSGLDKLYTGRYSPSEKIISIMSPHEGMSRFREIPQFLQQLLQRKFPEAEKVIRYS